MLTHSKFHTLKNFELLYPASIEEIILIIKHFAKLERLVFFSLIKDYASNTLSERISQLLEVTPTARPDMVIEVQKYPASIKVRENILFCFFF